MIKSIKGFRNFDFGNMILSVSKTGRNDLALIKAQKRGDLYLISKR